MAIDLSTDTHTHNHTHTHAHRQQNDTQFQWDLPVCMVDLGNVFITFIWAIHTRDKLNPSHTHTSRVTLPFSLIVWLMSLLMFHMVHLWGYDPMYWSDTLCESLCMCMFCICLALECKCVWRIARGSLSWCMCTCEWVVYQSAMTCVCAFEACVWPSVIDYRRGVIGIIALLSGGRLSLRRSVAHLYPAQTSYEMFDVFTNALNSGEIWMTDQKHPWWYYAIKVFFCKNAPVWPSSNWDRAELLSSVQMKFYCCVWLLVEHLL